jgi:hypothetical protein
MCGWLSFETYPHWMFGQDTIVTIEKYHTTLNVKKKSGKNRMVGGCKAVAKDNTTEKLSTSIQ